MSPQGGQVDSWSGPDTSPWTLLEHLVSGETDPGSHQDAGRAE